MRIQLIKTKFSLWDHKFRWRPAHRVIRICILWIVTVLIINSLWSHRTPLLLGDSSQKPQQYINLLLGTTPPMHWYIGWLLPTMHDSGKNVISLSARSLYEHRMHGILRMEFLEPKTTFQLTCGESANRNQTPQASLFLTYVAELPNTLSTLWEMQHPEKMILCSWFSLIITFSLFT